MIRIDTERTDKQVILRVAGRLCGISVEALEECWRISRREKSSESVDLSDVTSIDRAGWRLLRRMHAHGVELSGKGLATQTILDELTYEEEKGL
jgi:anti-anti-sigma regulatory factor